MRRLLLALGFALALCAGANAQPSIIGPPNAIQCNQGAQFAAASATTTNVITAVAGQRIYICGWHVTSNQTAANTFQLEYGTGSGCGTPTTLTPALVVEATAPATDHTQFAVLQTVTGAQLCVVTTGTTVGTNGVIWFAQF